MTSTGNWFHPLSFRNIWLNVSTVFVFDRSGLQWSYWGVRDQQGGWRIIVDRAEGRWAEHPTQLSISRLLRHQGTKNKNKKKIVPQHTTRETCFPASSKEDSHFVLTIGAEKQFGTVQTNIPWLLVGLDKMFSLIIRNGALRILS